MVTFWILSYVVCAIIVGLIGHFEISKDAVNQMREDCPSSDVACLPNCAKFLFFVLWTLTAPIFVIPFHSKKGCAEIRKLTVETLKEKS